MLNRTLMVHAAPPGSPGNVMELLPARVPTILAHSVADVAPAVSLSRCTVATSKGTVAPTPLTISTGTTTGTATVSVRSSSTVPRLAPVTVPYTRTVAAGPPQSASAVSVSELRSPTHIGPGSLVGGAVGGVVTGGTGAVVGGTGAVVGGTGAVVGGTGAVAGDAVDGSVVRVVVAGAAASVDGTTATVVDEPGDAVVVAAGPDVSVIGTDTSALERVIVSEHALPSSMPAMIEGMYSSCASVRFMQV